jgi:hypothetical protein
MKTFTYAKSQKSDAIRIDDDEIAHVQDVLGIFQTKTQAITYLHLRGWPTSDICKIIRYDDGRELQAPHVNQVRAKARASGVTHVLGHR